MSSYSAIVLAIDGIFAEITTRIILVAVHINSRTRRTEISIWMLSRLNYQLNDTFRCLPPHWSVHIITSDPLWCMNHKSVAVSLLRMVCNRFHDWGFLNVGSTTLQQNDGNQYVYQHCMCLRNAIFGVTSTLERISPILRQNALHSSWDKDVLSDSSLIYFWSELVSSNLLNDCYLVSDPKQGHPLECTLNNAANCFNRLYVSR